MTIKNMRRKGKIEVDLHGPEGNAFALLALGKNLAKQLKKEWGPIQKEMTSGDYENLVQVFDEEFGDYVNLYR